MDIQSGPQTDANALRDEIQMFLQDRSLSVSQFATMARVPAATIQNVRRPDWSPSFSVLQACISAVRRAMEEQRVSLAPVEFELPAKHLERFHNIAFKKCWEAWQQSDMCATLELTQAIEEAGLATRMSIVQAGEDNRIWLKRFGPAVFGKTLPKKIPLAALPDRRFGVWIEERIWRVLLSGEPVFASCQIAIETVVGTYDVPYTTLRLPLRKTSASPWFDTAITVSLLSDSPYQEAISGTVQNQT